MDMRKWVDEHYDKLYVKRKTLSVPFEVAVTTKCGCKVKLPVFMDEGKTGGGPGHWVGERFLVKVRHPGEPLVHKKCHRPVL